MADGECRAAAAGKDAAVSVTVLLPVFEGKVIRKTDMLAKVLFGPSGALKCRSLLRRLALLEAVLWLAGAACMFYTSMLVEPLEKFSLAWLLTETCLYLGAFCAIHGLLLFNCWVLHYLLFRTFEGPYITILLLLSSVGTIAFLNFGVSQFLFMSTSLAYVLYIDAGPLKTVRSRVTDFNIFVGFLLQICMVSFYSFSLAIQGRIHEPSKVRVPSIGTISLFQRIVVSPMLTSGIFFLKYFYRKLRYSNRTVLLYSRMEELTFRGGQTELAEHIANRLKQVNAQFEAQNLLETNLDSTLPLEKRLQLQNMSNTFLRPRIQPIIFNPKDTVAARLLGKARGDNIIGFIRRTGLLYSVVVMGGTFASTGVILLGLGHAVPLFAMLFAAVFLVVIMMMNILICNAMKSELLLRSFDPAYLLTVSLSLAVGLSISLRDIRAICMIIVVFAGAFTITLFDAMQKKTRKYSGGVTFLVAAVLDIGMLTLFYTNMIPSVYVTELKLPGATKSVSSVQLFVIAPLLCLLPYHLRILALWVKHPERLVLLQSALLHTNLPKMSATAQCDQRELFSAFAYVHLQARRISKGALAWHNHAVHPNEPPGSCRELEPTN